MSFFNCCAIALCAFALLFHPSNAAESTCGNWSAYKDEKCFRIVDDTLRTFEESEKSCAALESGSIPAIIHTKEEQELLENYLFKTLKNIENVWIGAKVSNSSVKWIDSSALNYANWDAKGPRNKVNYCVEMLADESAVGKWLDEPCEKKNLVVCQKAQTWSLARLQKTFLDERKQLRDSLEDAKIHIKKLEQSIVPLGFVYVQLPNQPEPKSLWPTVEWKVVSSEYSGHFFRVEGGNALSFGQSQSDAFQGHYHEVKYRQDVLYQSGTNYYALRDDNPQITASNKVVQKPTNDGINGEPRTANETRPINYSVRIWKRVS